MNEPSTGFDRPIKFSSPSGALIALVAAGILSIGIFGVLDPASGARAFGIAVLDPRDGRLLAIAAGRDIVLGILLCALLALRNRRALAYATGVLALIPIFDGFVVLGSGDWALRPIILVHWASALFMLAIVALLRSGK
jgi:hypothetical protein